MTTLTKDQVKKIIQENPSNDPEYVVDSLIKRGYSIEGYEKKKGFIQSLVQEIARPWGKFLATVGSVGQGIEEMKGLGLSGMKAVIKGKGTSEQLARVSRANQGINVNLGYAGNYKPIQSTGEAIGTGLQMGATIAGMKAPLPGTVGQAAIQGGFLGGTLGGGAAIEAGKGVKDVALQTFLSGTLGAGTGALMFKGQEAFNKFLQTAPKNIYNKVLDMTTKLEKAGKDPSKTLLEQKIWGTMGSMSKQVAEGLEVVNNEIDKKLALASGELDTDSVINKAADRIRKKVAEGTYTDDEILKAIQNLPVTDLINKEKIPWSIGNGIRKTLDNPNLWTGKEVTSLSKIAAKETANALRDTIQSGTKTALEFEADKNLITASKLIAKQLDKKGWGQYIRDALTAIGTGGATQLIRPSALPEVAALGIGAKVASTPLAKTGTAMTINSLNNLLTKYPILNNALNKIQRETLLQFIKEHM